MKSLKGITLLCIVFLGSGVAYAGEVTFPEKLTANELRMRVFSAGLPEPFSASDKSAIENNKYVLLLVSEFKGGNVVYPNRICGFDALSEIVPSEQLKLVVVKLGNGKELSAYFSTKDWEAVSSAFKRYIYPKIKVFPFMVLFVDGEVEEVYAGFGRVDRHGKPLAMKYVSKYQDFVRTVNRRIQQP